MIPWNLYRVSVYAYQSLISKNYVKIATNQNKSQESTGGWRRVAWVYHFDIHNRHFTSIHRRCAKMQKEKSWSNIYFDSSLTNMQLQHSDPKMVVITRFSVPEWTRVTLPVKSTSGFVEWAKVFMTPHSKNILTILFLSKYLHSPVTTLLFHTSRAMIAMTSWKMLSNIQWDKCRHFKLWKTRWFWVIENI